ncbi:PIN domain-containing protein [Granulicella mallensis]|uniref:Putative nucleic acid-binding protein n=1 Tax=Granulicella mallensis TaxID=940614 RepID=A0A7W8EAS5_9BACT|nr:PIN domain-containing protein [Granulicella mallensis]MBB5065026.1 putative nucleic acid-binding protein [Granulicella mallensis]
MEWVDRLSGQIVGLDTAPLIYFIEKHPTYLPLVHPFFEAVERGDIQVVTSTLTLTEVLIHPLRQGNRDLALQYSRILLNANHLKTLSVSPSIATEAAHLRARHGFKTPDAIQIASAQHGNATFFLTNDEALTGTFGLQTLVLKHLLVHP